LEQYNYTLRWGVDEQLDAQISAYRIIHRALRELSEINSYLQFWLESDDVDDETVAYVAEKYNIEWASDAIEKIAEDYNTIATMLDKPTEYGQLSTEVNWDRESRPYVGTLEIISTPENDDVNDNFDDGTDDDSPRGFQ
jgi:hypothetical protein